MLLPNYDMIPTYILLIWLPLSAINWKSSEKFIGFIGYIYFHFFLEDFKNPLNFLCNFQHDLPLLPSIFPPWGLMTQDSLGFLSISSTMLSPTTFPFSFPQCQHAYRTDFLIRESTAHFGSWHMRGSSLLYVVRTSSSTSSLKHHWDGS